ncbi:MAG: arsenic efflux protein [Clostridia bacterium]|nr:arsenic efflux protein [Clostridia bacterium]
MLEVLQETIVDGLKLIPFLFIAYLIMEFIEHKTSNKSKEFIKKSGKLGPVIGGVLGIFPQCGFSAIAANLYAGRIITIGTLIAVFLSTSDEMLPIMISEAVPVGTILRILGIKLAIGIIMGFVIDLIFRKKEEQTIEHLCELEHCHCEEGILKSALIHTVKIFGFIFVISFLLNTIIHYVGRDTISNLILNKPILGPIISALVGIIPNCAASVILTELYLSNVISLGSMIAGLLIGAGVGILVLFKVNSNLKENLKILSILYIISVASGILIEIIS